MKKYRSIFLSDIHMGKTRNGYGGAKPNVEPLLKFIKNKEFEFVYLVGDIFDIWELLMNWKWESKYNIFIQEILRLSQQGSKIYYITGNHDDILERMYGLDFNGIEFCKQVIHTTAKKKKFFVSPFMDLQSEYFFKVLLPNEKLSVIIDQRDKEGKLLFASQDGNRRDLTSKNLLICYLKHPLMSFKVISAIHFEALKLWIKGVKLIKKNIKIKNNTTFEN